MAKFEPITHVLFDMDGLLLNTEDLYSVAFNNVLSQFGKTFPFEMKLKIMGSQSHEAANFIISELDLPITVEEFQNQTKEQFMKLFPDSQIMPGAQRLIEHLYTKGIPMGLATSSSEESYELKARKHNKELFSLLTFKTFGSSDPAVKRGKPYPDIFLVAASKFPDHPVPEKNALIFQSLNTYIEENIAYLFLYAVKTRMDRTADMVCRAGEVISRLSRDECLVFEDAINGVKAAKAAGMQVVMVPDPRVERSLTLEADLVLNSLEEFKPELFGLPPFDD